MLSERVDINALLGMVLEGIYRGVSVDRAVLALTNADGTRLAAKFVLGGDERLTKSFNFAVLNDLHYLSPECGPWLEGLVRRVNALPGLELVLVLGDLAEDFIRGLMSGRIIDGLEVVDIQKRHTQRTAVADRPVQLSRPKIIEIATVADLRKVIDKGQFSLDGNVFF